MTDEQVVNFIEWMLELNRPGLKLKSFQEKTLSSILLKKY